MIFKANLQRSSKHWGLSLVLLSVLLCAGCGKQTVATVASEFEANQMFDILHSNGFRVEKKAPEGEVKTWEIVVDEGWFGEGEGATAIQVLRDYGLPRAPEPETKAADSLGIISPNEERERQKRELQHQIERLLYTLPDVINANVIIAQPTDDVLSLQKTPPTATVSLVLKDAPKFNEDAVKGQVSGAVPNLKPENVHVLITQQSLREVPLEKLAAQRRSNAVFAVGIGVILLLALVLGAVWMIARRRREKLANQEEGVLADETEEFEKNEPALLNAEDEEDLR